ncbi:DUF6492 family protein [Phocaeicola plebeius]|uniref:DUF6492 family protein n=1 Tax=Phocaeicola plebeius TaxID=310297 RepID=UPI0026F2B653|nr:DUF6492 family protein [Phocaeicola plebeius]
MDIIISLATKDFQIVKKVVRYCRLYLQTEEESIFLITKIENKILFQHSWIKQNHVTLIDEDNMIPGLSFAKVKEYLEVHFQKGTHIYPGWYLQQFLKMGFALTPYAGKEYLIWDSDTIPLHKLCFKDKDKYLLTVKTENHAPYFDTMQRIFGFGKLCDRSFIAEHMPIKTSIMKELISRIEKAEIPGADWFEKIINATSGTDEQAFSEFETYGNYCFKYHPEIFETRPLTTMRTAGLLYGRGVTNRQLALLAKMEFDTASFELRHIPDFPKNIANWTERIFLAVLRRLKIVK